MVRRDSEKDDEINIGQIISDIRSRGDLINDDPIFFEELIAKKFKMHCKDTKKHQEKIAEIRELHRSIRISRESSRAALVSYRKWKVFRKTAFYCTESQNA